MSAQVVEPLRNLDRRPLADGILAGPHGATIVANCEGDYNCASDQILTLIESDLMRSELTEMRGRLWDLAGFYSGRRFANEVNRIFMDRVVKAVSLR